MDIKNWFKSMGRKKKVVPEEVKAPEVKTWQYSNLVIKCKCGNVQTLGQGVENGIQLILAPSEASYVKLMCNKCDSELTLQLVEGEKPTGAEITEVERVSNEGIQEEDKQEESL